MTGNIVDYIEWYGDFDFDVLPFNEVDNLVLSIISYGKFQGLIPSVGINESVKVCSLGEYFSDKDNYNACDKLEKYASDLLLAMKSGRRFKDALLCNYFNKHDFDVEEQFAALHVKLTDGTRFVSYCGTDDTLLGWKEDFNLAYQCPSPGQLEAAEYLKKTVADTDELLRVGGHSKGGNLAVFASISADKAVRDRIIKVYSNDGPGFMSKILDKPEYIELLDRIITIVPETSIVGMLLEHRAKYKIIRSSQKGMRQHDGMTWVVYKNGFAELDARSVPSLLVDDTISHWLEGISDAERQQFIDTIFDVCDRANIKKLSDFSKLTIKDVSALLKEMFNLDSETKKAVMKIITAFMKQSGKAVKEFRNA